MSTTNIKDSLNALFQQETLSKEAAKDILSAVGKGEVNEFQTTALLTCFQMRPITGEELAGFREAMIELALPIDLSDMDTIDIVGTGGDGKDTFNISTTSSLVVAGAGYKVAKHGNVGVSSICGSSNVLEHLGYKMTNNPDELRAYLDQANFCHMHAPLFHPAMKHVGNIRRGMKVKTFFNMLGPLLNPSRPKRQLVGVYAESLLPLFKTVFEDMGIEYKVIFAEDGYDEISLTGPFQVRSNRFDGTVTPADLGYQALDQSALHGGSTIPESAKILVSILEGSGTTAQHQVVCANAGHAIQCFKPMASLDDCIAEADHAIRGGEAIRMLKNLVG